MGGYFNPFDAPLQSEIQEHQQAQPQQLKAPTASFGSNLGGWVSGLQPSK